MAVVEYFDRPVIGSFASRYRVTDGHSPVKTHAGTVVVVVVAVRVVVVVFVVVTVVLEVVVLVVAVVILAVLVVRVPVDVVVVSVGHPTSSDSSAQSGSPSQYQPSRMHCSPVVHKNMSELQWKVVVVVDVVVVVVVVLVVVSSDAKHCSVLSSQLQPRLATQSSSFSSSGRPEHNAQFMQ